MNLPKRCPVCGKKLEDGNCKNCFYNEGDDEN